jgi:hypothetical protein
MTQLSWHQELKNKQELNKALVLNNILTDDTYVCLFHNSFNNPNSYPDFTIHFGNNEIPIMVHRFILSGRSDFFAAMLSNGMKEANERQVIIEDDEELVTLLIKSLYTGSLMVPSNDKAYPMLLLAGKYQLLVQEKQLLGYLEFNMSNVIAIQCLDLDADRPDFQTVIQKAKQHLYNNSVAVLHGDVLMELDIDKFKLLLDCTIIHTSVITAIEAIDRWVDHEKNNREVHTHELLKLALSKKKSDITVQSHTASQMTTLSSKRPIKWVL